MTATADILPNVTHHFPFLREGNGHATRFGTGSTAPARLTIPARFVTLRRMSKPIRRFVAVFLLLWLPLSTGSALAASLAMQLPQQGACHETAGDMPDGVGGHHTPPQDAAQTAADASPCSACGVCHLACTAYLDAPDVAVQLAGTGSQAVTFLPATFISHLSAPLDPPPLAAA